MYVAIYAGQIANTRKRVSMSTPIRGSTSNDARRIRARVLYRRTRAARNSVFANGVDRRDTAMQTQYCTALLSLLPTFVVNACVALLNKNIYERLKNKKQKKKNSCSSRDLLKFAGAPRESLHGAGRPSPEWKGSAPRKTRGRLYFFFFIPRILLSYVSSRPRGNSLRPGRVLPRGHDCPSLRAPVRTSSPLFALLPAWFPSTGSSTPVVIPFLCYRRWKLISFVPSGGLSRVNFRNERCSTSPRVVSRPSGSTSRSR